jgi:G3E family GTPase
MITVKQGQEPVPMTIITGYVGAGKTTLLNRILSGNQGLRTAVLVNDFGPVNIDSRLISGAECNIIALANGCACCQIRNNLTNTIEEVIAGPEGAEYIILEASSVAEPAELIKILTRHRFRDRIRLDSVISVIDTEQVFAHPEYMDLFQLKLSQVAYSDLVILNKVDLVNKREIEEVRTWINMNMKNVRIVEASFCDVPLEIVLGVGRFDPARQAIGNNGHDPSSTAHLHDNNHSFSTWRYESDRPFSLKALVEMVKHKLPDTVYRCKGVIYTADAPDRLAVLQVAGRRAEVSLVDEWNARKPHTEIIAIGAPGRINARQLRKNFDACLSTA